MNLMPHVQTRWAAILAAAMITACGCSRSDSTATASPPAAPAAPAEKSTTDLVVDGITGRTAVSAGQKARATIDKVNAQREADMAETENF